MNNYQMDVLAGVDVGNGYVKAKLSLDGGAPVLADMPSAVSWISDVAGVPVEPTDEYLDGLVNELDCTIDSPAIRATDKSRLLVGRRAVASGDMPIMFDIDNATPKCDDPLAYELILATLAGTAVREFWFRERELPSEILRVRAYLGVALPIADFTAYAATYRSRLMGATHVVHVKNFDREVTVEVVVAGVEVLPEGAAAQYAIVDMGAPFLDLALRQARESGLDIDESETGVKLANYEDTVGIDIGEGTVNFPVFRKGHVAVESSSSINQGWGTVLDRVVAETRTMAFAPKSRKDLAEFLARPAVSGRDEKLKRVFAGYVEREAEVFARTVMMEYNRVFGSVKFDTQVVYVYGGGATPMREALYPKLIHEAEIAPGIVTPVIWLDSAYSRDLNRNGLFIFAQAARERQLAGQ